MAAAHQPNLAPPTFESPQEQTATAAAPSTLPNGVAKQAPPPPPPARAAPPPVPLPVHPPRGGRAELGASVRVLRPRAALPSSRRYDDYRTTELFGPLAAALLADGFHHVACGERELSKLTYRLILFAELTLGRDVPKELRPQITKLPWRFFVDYSPNGPLRTILATCLRFRAARGWTVLDPRDATRVNEHLELYKAIDRALKEERLYPTFKVHLAPAVAEDVAAELTVIVQRHGGAIVSTPEVASHVVYPDPPGTKEDETDAQVLVRYLKRESRHGGVRYFVHWWYHPDCYDDWVIAREVVGQVEPAPPERTGPWHLQERWIRDLDLFNEWMNERDYELPSSFTEYIGIPPRQPDNLVTSHVRLRLRMSDRPELEPAAKRMRADSDSFQLVGLPSIPQAVDLQRTTFCDTDQRSLISPDAAQMSPSGLINNDTSTGSVAENAVEGQELRVPSFSAWFDLDNVHDIEMQALPEFFSGKFRSKTMQVYVEIRNFMVLTWRRMPSRYLSATAARRQLRGDACSILRVHDFLEHWALINFGVDPEIMPHSSSLPPPPILPTRAGRVDPTSAVRHSLLFLGDGSAVEIDDNCLRRIRLDGTQISSYRGHRSSSGTMAYVLASLSGDAEFESTTTPVQAGRYSGTPQESYGLVDRSLPEPPLADANRGVSSGRSSRQERAVRSTRTVYGRHGRRSRTSRYIDNSSDEEIQDDDDPGEREENEDVADDSATEPEGAVELNEENKGEKSTGPDAIEYHCDICSKDCTRVRYHCATQADLDLCQSCFADRKYPPSMLPRDFIQMTSAPTGNGADGTAQHDPRVWSESETLLLLEALEMYGDSWDMIAEHVASKNQEQCVLQFLRLPIEDTFLRDLQGSWWSAKFSDPKLSSTSPTEMMKENGAKEAALSTLSSNSEDQRSMSGRSLIFADHVNTVTPQAAVLAGQVPPDVIDVLLLDVSAEQPRFESSAKDTLRRILEQCTTGVADPSGYNSNSCDGVVAADIAVEDLQKVVASNSDRERQTVEDRVYTTEECLTDMLHRRMIADAPDASTIAKSEFGVQAGRSALEFVQGDSGDDEPSSSMEPQINRTRRPDAALEGVELTSYGDKFAKVTDESSRCVAAVAMASAAARSAKLTEMVSLELARLYRVIYEVKLEMIGMKLRHLETIYAHRDASHVYAARDSMRKFGEDYTISRVLKGASDDSKICLERPIVVSSNPGRQVLSRGEPVPASQYIQAVEYVSPITASVTIGNIP